jgi:hypothetical protein
MNTKNPTALESAMVRRVLARGLVRMYTENKGPFQMEVGDDLSVAEAQAVLDDPACQDILSKAGIWATYSPALGVLLVAKKEDIEALGGAVMDDKQVAALHADMKKTDDPDVKDAVVEHHINKANNGATQ